MTRPALSKLVMVLAGVWVAGIFILYMLQFKPVVISLTDWLTS